MYVVFFQQKKGTKIIFSLFVIRFGSRCCLFSLQALALLLAALRLGINSTAIRTLIVIYSEIVFALIGYLIAHRNFYYIKVKWVYCMLHFNKNPVTFQYTRLCLNGLVFIGKNFKEYTVTLRRERNDFL